MQARSFMKLNFVAPSMQFNSSNATLSHSAGEHQDASLLSMSHHHTIEVPELSQATLADPDAPVVSHNWPNTCKCYIRRTSVALSTQSYASNPTLSPPAGEFDAVPPTSTLRDGGPKMPEPSGAMSDASDPHLVTWDSPDDPENPQNWSKTYKWFLTILCAVMTVNITLSASAPTTTASSIAMEFNVSDEVTYLITSLFECGNVIGPMLWGPGSELLGRRPTFFFTLISFTLLHLGQSLAPNIETLLVTRFLAGVFGVAPLSNCGGIIVDIWPAAGRGAATAVFISSVFFGPAVGPVVGSFLTESHLGWRSVYWTMMIYSGVCTVLVGLIWPETYTPVLLQKKAQRLRRTNPEANRALYAEHEKHDWTIKGILDRTVVRPFYMLYKEPILAMATAFLSLETGVLYALFEAIPVIFIVKRGFSLSEDGLIFLGVGIGASIGAVMSIYLDGNTPEMIKRWRGFPPPENRLYGAMVGGPCLVIGIFWMGWTGEYPSVPWYVPALSAILVGASFSLLYISFSTYILDTYVMYAASAMGANVMVRSCIAAATPLFTVQIFTKMGVNWAGTLVGLLGLLLTPSPFLFFRYGSRIRSRSTFAPCIDLYIEKELRNEDPSGEI